MKLLFNPITFIEIESSHDTAEKTIAFNMQQAHFLVFFQFFVFSRIIKNFLTAKPCSENNLTLNVT